MFDYLLRNLKENLIVNTWKGDLFYQIFMELNYVKGIKNFCKIVA